MQTINFIVKQAVAIYTVTAEELLIKQKLISSYREYHHVYLPCHAYTCFGFSLVQLHACDLGS